MSTHTNQGPGTDVGDLDHEPIPVDAATSTATGATSAAAAAGLPGLTGAGAGGRRVLPGWARDAATAKAAAGWAVRHSASTCAFHLVRCPVYWTRLAVLSPVGAWRLTRATARWALDVEAAPVRAALAAGADKGAGFGREDAATFLRLQEARARLVRGRIGLVLTALTVLAVSGLVVAVSADRWVTLTVLLAVLAGLGVAGRRADKPVVSRAVSAHHAPRLTSELILTALGSLGIGELNKHLRSGKDVAGVRFPSPITREGPGWRADVDLPPGVTAAEVIDRRDRLASGLRRPEGCVWPETDPDAHAGRLVLWVGDRPLSGGKPLVWPLAAKGKVNIFDPVPLGTDQRGRPVSVTLMFASGIIGAVPRMGKTFVLRLLLCAAALDPRVRIHAYNLKGGPDLDPLAKVAHAYRVGDEPDDIAYMLNDWRALREDMRARYRALRSLPKDVCPEAKITDELATKTSLGLAPVLLAVDECQVAFEHPTHGKELCEIATDLVKRGPAVGIMAWFATQRPDAASLPTGISANAVLRLCLKVTGQLENDMVLGTSSYKAGIKATMFSRKDRGVAYLAGEGDDPLIVRTAYIDGPTADTITTRAHTARATAGLLTGYAAGLDPDPDTSTDSVLDHLLTVWPEGQPRAWCDTLATALATTYPGTYEGWAGEQVTAAVKPHGLRTTQIKRVIDSVPVNKRGLIRADLLDALTDRNDPHPTTDPHDGPTTGPDGS